MSRYAITPAALQDLNDIADYIAADNPVAADRVLDNLFEAFVSLATRPGMGHARPDLTTQPLKFWTVRNRHLIVYRERAGKVEILRVLGAGRDVATILG